MKRVLVVCAAAAALGCSGSPSGAAGSDQASTASISFDLMHTRPQCSHPGEPDTWCTADDRAGLAQASGMEDRVKAMIDRAQDASIAKIVFAYFSFSDQAIFDKLCDKAKAGFDIEGFFDQSYRTGLPAKLAQSCQGPSGKNVRVHFLGQLSQSPWVWRLHHNKFFFVDPGTPDARVSLGFSSGNLSSFGMAVHFDHWVLTEADRGTDFVRQHGCVMEGLRRAIDPDGSGTDRNLDDPDVYRSTLEACFAREHSRYAGGTQWVEQALASEQVAPLFSPNPSGDNARILVEQISRVQAGGRIYGAMQHFLHYEIAEALAAAAQRGVEVRLIMDAGVITGTSEVSGVKDFYDQYLKKSVSGIDIQFLLTNAGAFQMMHNKFLVMEKLDGTKTRVFSGAGHFTEAGMRDNYENFYVTENGGLSAKYAELFDYMWPRTLTEDKLTPQK